MKLSEHFTLEELTHSNTAISHGLDNTPNGLQIFALTLLCSEVLEPIRALFGKPIDVAVAFRSQEVNKLVGGVANSQHCKGEACDFTIAGIDNADIVNKTIEANIPFEQIIWEQRIREDG